MIIIGLARSLVILLLYYLLRQQMHLAIFEAQSFIGNYLINLKFICILGASFRCYYGTIVLVIYFFIRRNLPWHLLIRLLPKNRNVIIIFYFFDFT